LQQAQPVALPMLNSMSFKKSLLCVGGLLLAVGGPIGMFSANDLVASARKNLFSRWTAKASADPQAPSTPQAAGEGYTPNSNFYSPTHAASLPSLDEVLRFDRTVEWVMQRWPRVSTGLTYLQLQGYRVPLVTGTGLSDVAGSLTYYFNAGQQVQRITLRGTTGDPGGLVSLVAGRYRFARRLTNDPGVVLYEAVDSSNKPAGSLTIRSAGVVKASQPYTRFEVDLAMDRPE
jgi:hypothetical protein